VNVISSNGSDNGTAKPNTAAHVALQSKRETRDRFRQARRCHHDELHKAERIEDQRFMTRALTTHFEEILALREGDAVWGVYRAHQSELNLSPSIEALAATWPRLRFAYPVITAAGSLQFYVPQAEPHPWQSNSFSILEPNPEAAEVIGLSELAGVFVPGIAFDRTGHRVGSGKGFYDRALAEYRGLRVGVGYSVQISEDAFSAEQHDIQMDLILTEQGVVTCERSENRSRRKG
jgi:5-formyltetrahydrofolate cyclo-ligase